MNATGSYEATVLGAFTGFTLVSTLSGIRQGIPDEIGDPIYTVESTWNVFKNLNQPPEFSFKDSGTITVKQDGTADIAIDLIETKTMLPIASLNGKGLQANTGMVDGMTVVTIQGPATSKPINYPRTQATFLINATSMQFSSSVSSSRASVINNGKITAMQGAGGVNGNTTFAMNVTSVPEPPGWTLWLVGAPLAFWLLRRRGNSQAEDLACHTRAPRARLCRPWLRSAQTIPQ